MSEYSLWKDWSENDFGCDTLGDDVYFKKLFKIADIKIEGKRVLEIGFGNGRLMSLLKKLKCSQVIGVEQIDLLVDRATMNSFEAYLGTVYDISEFDNMEFDLIIAIDVLEHLEYEELVKFFHWSKIHLSKSGSMVVRFPEGASSLGLHNQNGDFTHKTSLTETKMNFLTKKSGLKLSMYFDDFLYSNTISNVGIFGKLVFKFIEIYTFILKRILQFILYPITPSTKWTTNSIAVIKNQQIRKNYE